ncbi:MAG: hypothetical protein AB7E96_05270 [Deferribacterales bacterium]
MNNCKLLIFNNDELQIIQCRSDDPASFVVRTADITEEMLSSAVYMRLEWFEGDTLKYVSVTVQSYDGTTATLAKTSEVFSDKSEQYHLIDVSDPIDITQVDTDSVMDYRQKADSFNNRFRNSLTAQIKKILTEETYTNQLILKMLMQIDNKLDDLLSLKQSEQSAELKTSRMIYLSGGEVCFLSQEGKPGDIFYIQTPPSSTPGIAFAALCKIKSLIEAGKNRLCECEFVYIDEMTRDGIIHYVFEKDREKLKRKKING